MRALTKEAEKIHRVGFALTQDKNGETNKIICI
jgi:hypothetical protein